MNKQRKILAQVEEHLVAVLDTMTTIPADIIFNDVQYEERVIQPAYTVLSTSISGLTLFVPSAKKNYTTIMYAIRNQLIERNNDSVSLKENSITELRELIRESISPKSMAKGAFRWIINLLLNITLVTIFFGSIIMTQLATSGGISLGIVAMLLIWVLMGVKLKLGMRLPYAPADEVFKKSFLVSFILISVAIPFNAVDENSFFNWVAPVLEAVGVGTIFFLKFSGWDMLIAAKYGGVHVLLKRLIFALIGFFIGLYIARESSFINMLILGYIGASTLFGFILTSASRNNSILSSLLPRFANTSDYEEDERYREYDLRNQIITRSSAVVEQNYKSFLARILYYIGWLIASTPIGVVLIPYYLYLIIVSKKV